MPILAISLLFGSAFLHTVWNVLLKQAGEKYIATWWAISLGSVVFLPFLLFTGLPARQVWGLLFFSVLAEAAYYVILSAAYGMADFSLVYPLARGTAPALVAAFSILFLHETLSLGGGIGLALIVFGLLLVGGSNIFLNQSEKPHVLGIILAFSLSFLIATYTLLDGNAVKHTPSFPYAVMIFFLTPLIMSPLMFRRYGWKVLRTELGSHWVRILAIGLLIVITYMMVLVAYSISTVSYASATREVSVILGALVGWRFLGERLGGWRLAGSVVIFCGILVVALLG